MINEILLRRRNKILAPEFMENDPTEEDLKNQRLNVKYAATMMKNIQNLGYTFSEDLFCYITKLELEKIKSLNNELVTCLKGYLGADVTYEPFYPNFPEQVMNASDVELFVNAIIHYWSNGTLIPNYKKEERFPLIDDAKLTVLDIGTEDELNDILKNLIQSKTSLSEQDKTDLITLLKENFSVDNLPDTIPFKENVCLVGKLIMENVDKSLWFDCLSKYFKTATDVLRLATALSNGDVSLAKETKFKSFTRAERKLLLSLLENCNSIEEDMKRYQTHWVILGERLHPGEYTKYTKVNIAFGKIRNNGKINTFAGLVEEAIRTNHIENAVNLLKKRPGEFARKLDSLLRNANSLQQELIWKEFGNVAKEVSIPVLLQVREHFMHRNNSTDTRIFFPKGTLQKSYTINNELEDISLTMCRTIVGMCDNGIIEQLKEKENLGKVFISPSIRGYAVPQSQRSASSGMKIVTRTSRFPIEKDFVRLFIHWQNEFANGMEYRTDIDLSCSFLNEKFESISHVSYTCLRNGYSFHSGDFVDAPISKGGSSEFVDININKAIEHNARYAVVQIYGYTNTKFRDLETMYAGWMEREDPDTGEVFEASTVKNKINLTGETYCAIPMVLDFVNKEIVWLDLALTTSTYFPRCVEGNVRGIAAVVKGIVNSHKPQMFDLAILNAIARGTRTWNRNEADIIFDIDTSKPIEKVIVEVRNEKGELIETKTEERVRENVKIITPFDCDYWQGEML